MNKKSILVKSFILGSLFSNTGCVTKADVSNKINAWIGADVDELVSQWGPPHQSHFNKNSTRVFQYASSESGTIPITTSDTTLVTTQGHYPMTINTPRTQYLPYNTHCRITFIISPAGKVIRASWKGDTDLCHRHSM